MHARKFNWFVCLCGSFSWIVVSTMCNFPWREQIYLWNCELCVLSVCVCDIASSHVIVQHKERCLLAAAATAAAEIGEHNCLIQREKWECATVTDKNVVGGERVQEKKIYLKCFLRYFALNGQPQHEWNMERRLRWTSVARASFLTNWAYSQKIKKHLNCLLIQFPLTITIRARSVHSYAI